MTRLSPHVKHTARIRRAGYLLGTGSSSTTSIVPVAELRRGVCFTFLSGDDRSRLRRLSSLGDIVQDQRGALPRRELSKRDDDGIADIGFETRYVVILGSGA